MFIDANIFISAFTKEGKKSQKCKTLIHRITKGEQNATTSPMVLDEALYVLSDISSREAALKAYRKILSLPNLRILPVDRKCCEIADKFVMEGLEPQDAFHAAVMKINEISTICSFDKHFDKIEGIKRQEPK
ncbi:MAG: type II toxin-antitoxin system VapC family toxin [Candidatus Micrarchaeota archaeon]